MAGDGCWLWFGEALYAKVGGTAQRVWILGKEVDLKHIPDRGPSFSICIYIYIYIEYF